MGDWPRRSPYFPLAGDPMENAHLVSTSLWHFPKCIHYSVSIAEKVSNTLWAVPKESPIPVRYCRNSIKELLNIFPHVSWRRF
jgi:hypothetical protein